MESAFVTMVRTGLDAWRPGEMGRRRKNASRPARRAKASLLHREALSPIVLQSHCPDQHTLEVIKCVTPSNSSLYSSSTILLLRCIVLSIGIYRSRPSPCGGGATPRPRFPDVRRVTNPRTKTFGDAFSVFRFRSDFRRRPAGPSLLEPRGCTGLQRRGAG
eukprot:SAG22_NODE_5518_length_1000_cov_2.890122_2_plen_161_part_00